MDNSLMMYSNLQYNPISIPDFTILELYQDSIAEATRLGYSIIPIEGLSTQEIEDKCAELAATVQPDGYTSYILLTGAEGDFSHKIVYGVWYSGDAPSYPSEPAVSELVAADSVSVWQTLEVPNSGAPAFASITLTLSAFDNIEFYINGDYFHITIDEPVDGVDTVIINKSGVYYNDKAISTFEIDTLPKLQPGTNYIEVNATNITKVGIKYREQY